MKVTWYCTESDRTHHRSRFLCFTQWLSPTQISSPHLMLTCLPVMEASLDLDYTSCAGGKEFPLCFSPVVKTAFWSSHIMSGSLFRCCCEAIGLIIWIKPNVLQVLIGWWLNIYSVIKATYCRVCSGETFSFFPVFLFLWRRWKLLEHFLSHISIYIYIYINKVLQIYRLVPIPTQA